MLDVNHHCDGIIYIVSSRYAGRRLRRQQKNKKRWKIIDIHTSEYKYPHHNSIMSDTKNRADVSWST